jgi:hypothetical protein
MPSRATNIVPLQSGHHRQMTAEDLASLREAAEHLEHPSLAARLSNVVGTPIEMALQMLPRRWYRRIHRTAESVIEKALAVAVSSMHLERDGGMPDRFYSTLSVVTGAAGGLFGLLGLLVELPVTTAIMMGAIAEIARREGENLDSLEARLACVQVFALGGRAHDDDAAETGYYGVRLALATAVSSAAAHAMQHGVTGRGAPLLLDLIGGIASRFGATLSQKGAAQIVPIVGAAGAATINLIFVHHFQEMAHAHFTVRRLERKYGADFVRSEYEKVTNA